MLLVSVLAVREPLAALDVDDRCADVLFSSHSDTRWPRRLFLLFEASLLLALSWIGFRPAVDIRGRCKFLDKLPSGGRVSEASDLTGEGVSAGDCEEGISRMHRFVGVVSPSCLTVRWVTEAGFSNPSQ